MAEINVKFLTGAKDNIDPKISNGTIDKGDLIITSDTDELVFINPEAEKKVVTSRTQKAYTLNGTNLGSLEDGATIEAGINIDDLLTMITQKAIPATYEAPTIAFTVDNSTTAKTYEYGSTVNLALSTKYTQNDAGVINTIALHKNDDTIASESATVLTRTLDYTVDNASSKLWASANYAAGPIKNNNLGQESPEGSIAAGTISSKEVLIKGARKSFIGSGEGEIPEMTSSLVRSFTTGAKLGAANGTTFTLSMPIGHQYAFIAYPSTLRDIAQVEYVELGDKGMAPLFEKSLIQVEGANGYEAAEYKLYTYQTAAPIAAAMTLKFTI